MPRRVSALDSQPGSLPDILPDTGGLKFVMRPRGTNTRKRLVIRCEDAGEVWVSIQPDEGSSEQPIDHGML
jgi:hypothetical protein